MAANTHVHGVRQPSDVSIYLWRYLDLPRLVSLVSSRQLHFACLCTLDDKYEGLISPIPRAAMSSSGMSVQLQSTYGAKPITEPSELEGVVRTRMYANCWCSQAHESEALWRIYAYPCGVAIQTRYDRLCAALRSDVAMGMVEYVDPATNTDQTQSLHALAMRKRKFFSHEQECRLLVYQAGYPGISSNAPRRSPDPSELVDVDIDAAFERIVVSPHAPAWFGDCVRAIVQKFGVSVPIADSTMR